MSKTFAESYLIEMLGSQLLLEPGHDMEVSRGIELALQEFQRTSSNDKTISLEKLASAVERMGSGQTVATLNLLNMPLGRLWVREALQQAKAKLSGKPHARVVIIGLWHLLKGDSGRRTEKTEERFIEWKNFVEDQLMGANVQDLTILWVG